jgi:hypothetical protein
MNNHAACRWLEDLLFAMDGPNATFYRTVGFLPEHTRAIEYAIERMNTCDDCAGCANPAPPPRPTTQGSKKQEAGNIGTAGHSQARSRI